MTAEAWLKGENTKLQHRVEFLEQQVDAVLRCFGHIMASTVRQDAPTPPPRPPLVLVQGEARRRSRRRGNLRSVS